MQKTHECGKLARRRSCAEPLWVSLQYRGQAEELLQADDWALFRDFLGRNCRPEQVT